MYLDTDTTLKVSKILDTFSQCMVVYDTYVFMYIMRLSSSSVLYVSFRFCSLCYMPVFCTTMWCRYK